MEFQKIHIFYFSGWKEPKIHYGFTNSQDPWITVNLNKYPSYREIWCIEIPVTSSQFTLEFVFCNSDKTDWDHPTKIKAQQLNENYQINSIGSYFIYTGKQLQVTEEFVTSSTTQLADSVNRIMVITDLDGTLFEDNEKGRKALRNFNSFWLRKLAFAKDKSLKPVLVYSTGRNFDLFSKLQREAYLLWPEYFIGGTGTYIYKYNSSNDQYELDPEWQSIIKQNWDYDIIQKYFNQLSGFELQSPDQNNDKSNLHYVCSPIDLNSHKQHIEEIKQELSQQNIKFNLIASGPNDIRYIDITSFYANKGKAMEFLAKKLGFSMNDVFSFGDSMNDIDMLARSKGGSYLVANSQEEIVKWMRMNQKKKSFCVKQSEYEYADALYHTLSNYYYEQS